MNDTYPAWLQTVRELHDSGARDVTESADEYGVTLPPGATLWAWVDDDYEPTILYRDGTMWVPSDRRPAPNS